MNEKYPIPLVALREAIESGLYKSKFVFCRIKSVRHTHYIKAKSRITNRIEYWVYNDLSGDYYMEDIDLVGKRQ